MSNYSIYFSPTGGTKKVADILAGALGGGFREVDLCRDVQPVVLNEQDICLISVPSYGGRAMSIPSKTPSSKASAIALETAACAGPKI